MDTKKLRQKILDLAIRGKLVPQDPNDEPASVLLERIRAEKEQLIKEGKIKRSKKSAATDKSHYENVPFEIPESWCWCKLSDVCNFESGYAFSSDDYKDKGTPLVRISNIQDGLVSLDNCVYIEGDIDKRFIINNGDLLIAMSGATTGKMGVYQYDCPALLNQRVGNIKVNTSLLLQKYRDYFMQSQGDLILKLSYGGAQPNVSAKIISDLFIPIPSLNEQEKIVAEIEKWFGFIDEIENGKIELESHIKKTKSKILDLAISGKLVPQDPNDEPAIELLKRINPDFEPCDNSHYENIEFDIPKNWVWATIGDVFEHNTGKALNASNPNGTMLDYITTSNLYWDRFELSIIKQMPFTESEIERCIVRKGDLLICEGGDVGRAAIWDYDYNIMIQNHIHRLRGKVDICTRYFFYLFMHYKLHNLIGGKGVAIQGLSSRDLHNLIIPVPSLKEQYDIASSIDLYFSKLDMITAEL